MKQTTNIEQLMIHSSTLNITQHFKLTFRIKNLSFRTNAENFFYIVELSNFEYYFKAYFREMAADLLYQQENDKGAQDTYLMINSISLINSIIEITKWRFTKSLKTHRVCFDVLEFGFVGEDKNIYKLRELDLNNYHKLPQQKLQDKNRLITFEEEPTLGKKVKNQVMSDFSKEQLDQRILYLKKYYLISELYSGLTEWNLVGRILYISPLQIFQSKFNNEMYQYFRIAILDRNQDIVFGYFTKQACDIFKGQLHQGKVYEFSNAKVEQKQKGQIQITFSRGRNYAKVEKIEFAILQIQELQKLEKEVSIDLLAYVQDIIITSNNRIILKITDQTGQMNLRIWRDYIDYKQLKGTVIRIYNVRVVQFQDSNELIITKESLIFSDQEEEDVKDISNFVASQLTENQQEESYQFYDLSEVEKFQRQKLLGNTQGPRSKIRTIGMLKKILSLNIVYLACPLSTCKKKVDYRNARYFCSKCIKEIEKPTNRYRFDLMITNDTNSIKAVIFDGPGEKLLQISAVNFIQLDKDEQQNCLLQIEGREYEVELNLSTDKFNNPQIVVSRITQKAKQAVALDMNTDLQVIQ